MRADFAYIGIKDGTIRAIVFDDERYRKDTAKLVADWIVMGRTVERVLRASAVARMRSEHAVAAGQGSAPTEKQR